MHRKTKYTVAQFCFSDDETSASSEVTNKFEDKSAKFQPKVFNQSNQRSPSKQNFSTSSVRKF